MAMTRTVGVMLPALLEFGSRPSVDGVAAPEAGAEAGV
jgi:hypothetical protein